MLTRVSNKPATFQKTYEQLFSTLKGFKEGSYRTYSGEEIILPEGFRLNTLTLNVEDDQGQVEETVVDYLGNELIVDEKQRESFTPQLLKHLEMIGRAMFSLDSENNLVINSQGAEVFSQESYLENSEGAEVKKSRKIGITNSPRTTVKNSTEIKVDNSEGAEIEKSRSVEVKNSPAVTIERSIRIKAENAPETRVKSKTEYFVTQIFIPRLG